MNSTIKVLIAGIGGASLGTEIAKCLFLSQKYEVYGCDISELAFGHYQNGFQKTFVVKRDNYIESILEFCMKECIRYIIPGGEEPMVILGKNSDSLAENGIKLAGNSADIISKFSNKCDTFKILNNLGFKIPLTQEISSFDELDKLSYPCIVKPSTGSGGSSFVFLAIDKKEAIVYINYLKENGRTVIVQEYIPHDEGEFTVGVLSLPKGHVAGAIALKRIFDSKLSVSFRGKAGIISSGYSQGLIDDFPEICTTAVKIATAIKSNGPLNIQGRVKNGIFLPFEINPRFSASTYLRAMAGFNEIDVFLQYIENNTLDIPISIKPGYYLRSLSEISINKETIKID